MCLKELLEFGNLLVATGQKFAVVVETSCGILVGFSVSKEVEHIFEFFRIRDDFMLFLKQINQHVRHHSRIQIGAFTRHVVSVIEMERVLELFDLNDRVFSKCCG